MRRVVAFILAGMCAFGLVSTPVMAKSYAAIDVMEETFIIVDGVSQQVRPVKTFDDGGTLYEGKAVVIQRTRAGGVLPVKRTVNN